ncbi:MAG: DUF4255 domain-containing protein [Bacteroidota bacterium]
MIHTTISILKDKLNQYLSTKIDSERQMVNYIASDGSNQGVFPVNTVTPFLINVSEDRKFRNADQHQGIINNGIRTRFNPEIRIELLVLFVSNFTDYDQALRSLSYVIKFFQANRIFTPENAPQLQEGLIEKLIIELISIPLEEQNQVWHSLNTSYLPSVLYRIRLLSFNDDDESIQFAGKQTEEVITTVYNK